MLPAELDVDPELIAQLRPPGWMRDAACLEHPTLPWFPELGERADQVAAAKQVCAGCLVRTECLAYARDERLDAGIWGGTTPGERTGKHARTAARVKAKRDASKVPCPTCGRPTVKLHAGECWACHCAAA